MMIVLALATLAQATLNTPPPVPPVAAPAPAPSAAGLAAARRLLKAMNIEAQYDANLAQLIPLMTDQSFNAFKDNVKIPAEVRQFLSDPDNLSRSKRDYAERVMKGFQARYPALIEESARAYASAFTADELDALARFYESPVGQKTLAVLPQLQAKLFSLGGKIGLEVGREAIVQTLQAVMPGVGNPRS